MLPEIGGLEWLVIAIVALVVIGPKDLPVMMRRMGQYMAKLRGMANEFRASFDEMARQSELDDLRKEVEAMRRGQFGSTDFGADMNSTVSEIEQSMADVGVQLHPPMSYQYDSSTAPPLEISEAPAPEPKPKTPRAKKAVNVAEGATVEKPKRAAKAATPTVEAPKSRKRAPKTVEGGA
ncbi:Sec-independent protein translocase protein TatB [Phenylobacterium sp.]|uniref:Sec-independent protein translocase protein TatB n=1 Tax=Phenylobacterium sp. TaxID=1871053 RepID=UPI00120AF732|nr:Sec-independent protein translocase protein TatB [Phenylobacterium sp.]TAL32134.1 MAG: twin-arginine translocase subunit TatB [Phenylobacterium sp.]